MYVTPSIEMPFGGSSQSGMSTQRFPIEERWSPDVAAKGFSAVPTLFLNQYAQLDITPTEAMLIIHLMSYKWDARRPFPSISMLRKKLGLSDGQVRALLRRLERQKRLLKRIQRIGRSNEFDFSPLIRRLEELQQKQDLEELDRQEAIQDQPQQELPDEWGDTEVPF